MKPLSVLTPLLSSATPPRSANSNKLIEPSTVNSSAPTRSHPSSPSSNSSWISPTSCSITLSRKTRPSAPPNSSTTRARCECSCRKYLSNWSRAIWSGTGSNSRRIEARSAASCPVSFSRSLMWINPRVLSRWPRTNGKRVCRDSMARARLSSKEWSMSRQTTLLRGTMMSRTFNSPNSKALTTILRSVSVRSCSSLSSTRTWSSSVVATTSPSFTGSMRNTPRRIKAARASSGRLAGWSARRHQSIGHRARRTTDSGWRIPIDFGTSSPKTTSRASTSTKAMRAAASWLPHHPGGRPMRHASASRARPTHGQTSTPTSRVVVVTPMRAAERYASGWLAMCRTRRGPGPGSSSGSSGRSAPRTFSMA